jgi:hypothetical protein
MKRDLTQVELDSVAELRVSQRLLSYIQTRVEGVCEDGFKHERMLILCNELKNGIEPIVSTLEIVESRLLKGDD